MINKCRQNQENHVMSRDVLILQIQNTANTTQSNIYKTEAIQHNEDMTASGGKQVKDS